MIGLLVLVESRKLGCKNKSHKNSLSKIENPVLLYRIDTHAIWVNDRALQLAEIDYDSIIVEEKFYLIKIKLQLEFLLIMQLNFSRN